MPNSWEAAAKVSWAMCEGDVWCWLDRVDAGAINVSGVYLIGYSPFRSDVTSIRTIYVGRGNVSDGIEQRRKDRTIVSYFAKGVVFVTWTNLPFWDQGGVERFLVDTLTPLEHDSHLGDCPIQVNLPDGWI